MTGIEKYGIYVGTQHYPNRKNPSLIARYKDKEIILGSLKNEDSERIFSTFIEAIFSEIDFREFLERISKL